MLKNNDNIKNIFLMGLIYLGILVSYIAVEMVIKFIPEPRLISNPNCLSYFCLVLFFFDVNYSFLGYRYRRTAILFTSLLYLLCLLLIITNQYEPNLILSRQTDFYFIYGLILGYYWILSPNQETPAIIDENNAKVDQDNAIVEFDKSEIPKALYRFIKNILYGNLQIKFFLHYKHMNNYTQSKRSNFNYRKFFSDSVNDFLLFYSGYIITQILQAYMMAKKDFNTERVPKQKRFMTIIKQYIGFVFMKFSFILLINSNFNSALNVFFSKYIPQRHFIVLYNMLNFGIEKKGRLINTIILSFI